MKINDIITEGSEQPVDEGKTGPGLWANIHAKRKRIKNGGGERMRKPGTKGSPTAANFKAAASEGVAEGLGKDIKRLATGKDVKSRAGQEIAKSQDASMKGDTKTSKKHFNRFDKLDKLSNKEQGVAEGSETEGTATLAKIAAAGDNGYDMIEDGLNGLLGTEAQIMLQDMYDDVSREHRLHPDDDFEQIYDRMMDRIESDYGQQSMAEGYQDDGKEREENLRYARSRNPVADAIRKKLNPNQKSEKKQGVAEGKEDKIKQLKQDYDDAVYWSKNATNHQKREAERQKAERIKRHLQTQYKVSMLECWDPDTTRLEQDVRDALENGDDYTAKQYAKMASTSEAKKYLLNIIKQAMYIDDLGGETDWKGVAGGQLEETYHDDDLFFEAYGIMEYNDEMINEAEYQGRKVTLNKPMQGDVKKFLVYVKDPKTGNIKKVNFGQKGARIKKNNPGRRKNFRARHNCDNPGPKTSARYWSCRKW